MEGGTAERRKCRRAKVPNGVEKSEDAKLRERRGPPHSAKLAAEPVVIPRERSDRGTYSPGRDLDPNGRFLATLGMTGRSFPPFGTSAVPRM